MECVRLKLLKQQGPVENIGDVLVCGTNQFSILVSKSSDFTRQWVHIHKSDNREALFKILEFRAQQSMNDLSNIIVYYDGNGKYAKNYYYHSIGTRPQQAPPQPKVIYDYTHVPNYGIF